MSCDIQLKAATGFSRPGRISSPQGLFRSLGLCLTTAVVLLGVAVAIADDTAKPLGSIKFDIPAEPLAEALQAYSVATNTQVMFETTTTDGYRSAPLQGEYTAEAALQQMLADTDLRVRYTRANAITVAPNSAPDVDEPPSQTLAPAADLALGTLNVSAGTEGDRGRLGEYIGVIQSDIQRALKKAGKARAGEYRAEVKLWVDQSRTIQRAELSRSNGDKERDTQIASVLHGLVLSQLAPTNTPQPLRFMIAIRTL